MEMTALERREVGRQVRALPTPHRVFLIAIGLVAILGWHREAHAEDQRLSDWEATLTRSIDARQPPQWPTTGVSTHARVSSAASLTVVQSNGRPAEGSGPIGMNYGDVPAQWFDAGERARIWYVTEGPHAVPAAMDTANDVPAYVSSLADVTESVFQSFESQGWRLPLSDADRGLVDDGGDGRFDIYLLDFGGGADGLFSVEFCEDGGLRCGGYIAMENDFAGYSYASHEEAFRTLVSHELAHAVGAAYAAGQPTWWDEGFAVWAELEHGGVTEDVYRLMRRWFFSPEKPLDSMTHPGDSWPYAASAFVVFIADNWGAEFLTFAWESLASSESRSAVAALDRAASVLEDDTLDGLWSEFGLHAWFVGDRYRDDLALNLRFGERFPTWSPQHIFDGSDSDVLVVDRWSFQAASVDVFHEWFQVSGCEESPSFALSWWAHANPLALPEGTNAALQVADAVFLIGGRTRSGAEQCAQFNWGAEEDFQSSEPGEDEDPEGGTDPKEDDAPEAAESSGCQTMGGGVQSLGMLLTFAWMCRWRRNA